VPNAPARAGAFPEEWESDKVPPPTVALEQELDICPSDNSRIATSRCDAGNGCRVACPRHPLRSIGPERSSCCTPAAIPPRLRPASTTKSLAL